MSNIKKLKDFQILEILSEDGYVLVEENGVAKKIPLNKFSTGEELDPTVPEWAKAETKPPYDKTEVGLGNVDNVQQYSEDNPPPYPVTAVNGKTGNVSLNTSDLNNNSGFITNAVADLANYYAKSQTYNRDEINERISAIPKFAISVVSALPTSGISTTTIYLVNSGSGADLYTEYIYTGGAWEILGAQRVDLTGYATEAWVNAKIADFLTADKLTAAMVTGALGFTPANGADVPSVDSTLKVSGAAADAKAVGDKVAKLSSAIVDKVDISTLKTAVDDALLESKNSGVFDGADGKSAYEYAQDGGYTGTEEEFSAKLAEEIPDALPNPHPLTFTGAVLGSYDGSETVTVDIPSGGGNSPWETVIDTTLTEAAALNTGEMPGKTEMVCVFAVPKVETAITTTSSTKAFGKAVNNIPMGSTSYGKIGFICASKICGHSIAFGGSGDTTTDAPGIDTTPRANLTAQYFRLTANTTDIPLIIGSTLPAGTIIKVFVR